MEKVHILPGCVSCGSCEAICPIVFKVIDVAHVISEIDLEKYRDEIKEAVRMCPVDVIKYEK